VFRDGADVDLRSRNSKPLTRYFPEVAAAVAALPVARLVLDGELIIPKQPFDTLQLRLHPAASRIKLLAEEHPATLVAFDLLADADGTSLLDRPFAERRKALAALFKRIGKQPRLSLARATTSRAGALKWLKGLGHGLDGIVAKRLDLAYQPGQRAMRKFKVWTTVDCVVGGLYLRPGTTNEIEFLLLGLYDPAGKLNYVGRARVDNERAAHAKLAPIVGGPGFTGNAPAGTSRWSGRERVVIPVQPKYVVEVSADHVEAGRFRHGSRLLRWRDDKEPKDCGMEQLAR
jgi:ATP-dependent DNA ligase